MESMEVKSSSSETCHVLALPYPGRGHVNPMMNLCKLLSIKKPYFLITFVVTEEWEGFLSSEAKHPNIRFATIPNCIPSEIGRAKDFPGFVEAVSTKMEAPFEKLLVRVHEIDPVSVIIADTYLVWVSGVGNRRNIPIASLWTMSASVFSFFHHFDLLKKNGHFPADLSERGEELVDYIPGITPTRLADLPTIFTGDGRMSLDRALEAISSTCKAQYLLFTSSYELDSLAIDALSLEFPFPLYPLGPSIPYFQFQHNHDHDDCKYYLKWLDCQHERSVLYISMGSFLSVSSAQMEEIVAGVHDSEVRFFWVSRGGTISFKDNCGGVEDGSGLVVPWCDQLRVLCHPSIGGFWTHCGWNSTLEGVYAGVPMLASPIFWDQIHDSKKIVEDWKIGWRVKGDNTFVSREEIANTVRRFMDCEIDEVKGMRERARNLSEVCQRAVAEGGSSCSNLDAFLNDISKGLKN